MAKYSIEHTCGHEITHQLYGRTRDREKKIEWLESVPCWDCKQEENAKARAEHNGPSAAENAADGLPSLDGTEKQIAWAESIRKDIVERFATMASHLLDTEKHLEKHPEKRPRAEKRVVDLGFVDLPEYFVYVQHAITKLQQTVSVSWWIDHRDCYRWQDLVEKEALADLAKKHNTSKEAGEAVAEVVLNPASPVSGTPAEISFADEKVTIRYPIKNRKFWEIVKSGLGFMWSGSCWEMVIGVTSGTAIDRVAEAGHRLLAAGFPVIIWEEAARKMALSGKYAPRHTRWITHLVKKDKFSIQWARNEDFYSEARKIASAKWEKPYVTILPGEYAELLDFAEIHNFQLSPGALEIVENEKIKRTTGLVTVAQVEERKATTPAGRPKLCADTVNGEINDDLLDD